MLSVGPDARRFSPSQDIYVEQAPDRHGNVHYRRYARTHSQSGLVPKPRLLLEARSRTAIVGARRVVAGCGVMCIVSAIVWPCDGSRAAAIAQVGALQ